MSFERVGLSALRPLGRILFALCAAGSAAACTEVVDSAVESRYAQYNYSVDWAKNEAILLNIVRASEYQPLNFMSFQPYQGTASVSASAAAPSFVIGPNRVASQKQYSISNSTLTASASGTGTVTVTSLDTSDFYDSLLSPVDYVNLNAFQRQGYPRELLFRLFADYVSLKPTNGDTSHAFIVYNEGPDEKRCSFLPLDVISQLYGRLPPDSPQRRICFEDLVVFAMLSGLSSEVRTLSASSSGGTGKTPAPAAAAAKGSPTPNSSSTPPKPQTEGRLCFDPALSNRAMYEYEHVYGPGPLPPGIKTAEYHPICGGTGADDVWPTISTKAAATPEKLKKPPVNSPGVAPPPSAAAVPPPSPGKPVMAAGAKPAPGVELLTVKVKTLTRWPVWDIHMSGHNSVEIGTRSTFSIYSFLGRLLRNPTIPSNDLIGPPDEEGDRYILTVKKGQPTGCFTTAFLDLSVYCVPLEGAQNTKRTFSILSQLLALKTTTDDLQLLPTIRLLPTQ